METHRKLTILGVVLLLLTIAIFYYHEEGHPGVGFNYAYLTGIAMIAVFLISIAIMNKEKQRNQHQK